MFISGYAFIFYAGIDFFCHGGVREFILHRVSVAFGPERQEISMVKELAASCWHRHVATS